MARALSKQNKSHTVFSKFFRGDIIPPDPWFKLCLVSGVAEKHSLPGRHKSPLRHCFYRNIQWPLKSRRPLTTRPHWFTLSHISQVVEVCRFWLIMKYLLKKQVIMLYGIYSMHNYYCSIINTINIYYGWNCILTVALRSRDENCESIH